MGGTCSCCREPTPADYAAAGLQQLVSAKNVTKKEVKQLKKEFAAMGGKDGWVDEVEAAAAQVPKAVWRGILRGATADVGGTPNKICFAEFALLTLSHSGNKAAEAMLFVVRAGCAFDAVAWRMTLSAEEKQKLEEEKKKAKKDKKKDKAKPKPPPRRVRRKSTLDKVDVWDALCMYNIKPPGGPQPLPGFQVETDVQPKLVKFHHRLKGRLTKEEYLAMIMAERPDLAQHHIGGGFVKVAPAKPALALPGKGRPKGAPGEPGAPGEDSEEDRTLTGAADASSESAKH